MLVVYALLLVLKRNTFTIGNNSSCFPGLKQVEVGVFGLNLPSRLARWTTPKGNNEWRRFLCHVQGRSLASCSWLFASRGAQRDRDSRQKRDTGCRVGPRNVRGRAWGRVGPRINLSVGRVFCFGDDTYGQCSVPPLQGKAVAVSAGFRRPDGIRGLAD